MAEVGDHIYIYEVCTQPSVKGFVLDMRYMMIDRLHYGDDPKRRDIWINAMVRWADSKGRVNFIKPESMEGGVAKPHLGQNGDYDFHRMLNSTVTMTPDPEPSDEACDHGVLLDEDCAACFILYSDSSAVPLHRRIINRLSRWLRQW